MFFTSRNWLSKKRTRRNNARTRNTEPLETRQLLSATSGIDCSDGTGSDATGGSTDTDSNGGTEDGAGSGELVAPQLPTAPSASGATLHVATTGAADFTSIQAAIDSAAPGDTIVIAEGTYAESLLVNGSDLLIQAEGNVTLTGDTAGHGIYIGGNNVEVNGITVTGIMNEEFNGYGGTGVVIAGEDVRVVDVVAQNNGVSGFLTLETARNVLIEGGSASDNSRSGLALGGGQHITVRSVEFFNTGTPESGDGNFQYYGIEADNTGDVRLVNGTPTYIEDQSPMSDLRFENLQVRNHPGYGIRISAENQALSTRPSARIDTNNVTLINSTITDNGSDTSSWVGGLYYLGGALLQHVQGGYIAGNTIQDNYTWGMDIYNSSNVVLRNNTIVNNNRGDSDPDVTIQSAGLEINAGVGNVIVGNIIAGHYAGLFSSYIPDTGDDFSTEYAQGSLVVRNNVLAGNVEIDFEVIAEDAVARTIENNLIQSVPAWHVNYIEEDVAPGFTANNSLFVDPQFTAPASGDFSFQDGSPAIAILANADAAPGGDDGTNDGGTGDTGSDDTGSGDTGSGDTGSGDTGAGDTGSGDNGTDTDDSDSTTSPQTIRQLILGHSLLNHFVEGDDPHNMGGRAVPYWLHQFAAASDNTYLVDGQWYSNHSFANGDEIWPQWGFQGGAEGVWEPETPLGSADFDSVVLSPYNFIQMHEDPTNVTSYLPLIDHVTSSEPGIRVYIYEGWADMAPFVQSFPGTQQEVDQYLNYALTDYQDWFDTFIVSLRGARPDIQFERMQVNEAVLGLLADPELGLQGRLSDVSQTDLFMDEAPHGTDTFYFLAAIATYNENFGQRIPSDFVVPDNVHPLVRANIADISEVIFQATTDGATSGGGDTGSGDTGDGDTDGGDCDADTGDTGSGDTGEDDTGSGDTGAAYAAAGDDLREYLLAMESVLVAETGFGQSDVRDVLTQSLTTAALPIVSESQFWEQIGNVVGSAFEELGLNEPQADAAWEAHGRFGVIWAEQQNVDDESPADAGDESTGGDSADSIVAYAAAGDDLREYLLAIESVLVTETGFSQSDVRDVLTHSLTTAALPIVSESQFWDQIGNVVGTAFDELGLNESQSTAAWDAHGQYGVVWVEQQNADDDLTSAAGDDGDTDGDAPATFPDVDENLGAYLLGIELVLIEQTGLGQPDVRDAIVDVLGADTIDSEEQFRNIMGMLVDITIDTLGLNESQANAVWDAHEQLSNAWVARHDSGGQSSDEGPATADPFASADPQLLDYLFALEDSFYDLGMMPASSIRSALTEALTDVESPISDRSDFWREMANVVDSTIGSLELTESQADQIWEDHERLGNELFTL